jgi:hypothetical protein
MQNFKRKAISIELSNDIDEMVKKIKEVFGLDISKIQASKIIHWKQKSYNVDLTSKRLLEILGSKI